MWRNGRRKRLKIARETMWVRVPPSAPSKQSGLFQAPGCFIFVAGHALVLSGKMLREIIRVYPFSHRIHIDIVEMVRAILLATDLPVQRLLFLHLFEHLLTGRDKRKCPAAGFCLSTVTRDIGHNAAPSCFLRCFGKPAARIWYHKTEGCTSSQGGGK